MTRPFPDIIINFFNKTVFLDNGNELVRINHAASGMIPPDERFRADNFILGNAVFGLEIHLELVFGDGCFHVFFNKFSVIQRFLKLLFIEKNICKDIIFGRSSCHSGAVLHLPHFRCSLFNRVDAERNVQLYIFKTVDILVDLPDEL